MLKKYRVEILVMLGLLILVISVSLPVLQRMRATSGRQRCPSNLRQIGQALLLYSIENHSALPATIEELVGDSETTWLQSDVIVCPDDSRSAASASNNANLRKQLATGKHTTYIYLGAGKILENLSGSDVVCYEPLSIHEEGGNVLFGDGHVEFVFAKDYPAVQSGHLPNPFTQPTSQPH